MPSETRSCGLARTSASTSLRCAYWSKPVISLLRPISQSLPGPVARAGRRRRWSQTACSSGPPGSLGTAGGHVAGHAERVEHPRRRCAWIRRCPRPLQFGTKVHPSRFLPLAFQPARAVANGAVTFLLPAGPPGPGSGTTGSALTERAAPGQAVNFPQPGRTAGPETAVTRAGGSRVPIPAPSRGLGDGTLRVRPRPRHAVALHGITATPWPGLPVADEPPTEWSLFAVDLRGRGQRGAARPGPHLTDGTRPPWTTWAWSCRCGTGHSLVLHLALLIFARVRMSLTGLARRGRLPNSAVRTWTRGRDPGPRTGPAARELPECGRLLRLLAGAPGPDLERLPGR